MQPVLTAERMWFFLRAFKLVSEERTMKLQHFGLMTSVGVTAILLFLLAACVVPGSPDQPLTIALGSQSPLSGALRLSGEPAVNKPFTLTVDLVARQPYTNLMAMVTLPNGIEPVGGPTEWLVPVVEPDQHYVFTTTAQVSENGYYKIWGGGEHEDRLPDGKLAGGVKDGETVYLIVEGDNAWFSNRPPVNTWVRPRQGTTQPLSLNAELLEVELSVSEAPQLNKPVEVIYRIKPLTDLLYSQVGLATFSGGMRARDARVVTQGEASLQQRASEIEGSEGVFYWNGAMTKYQTYEFRVTLEAIDNGEGQVLAWIQEVSPKDGHALITRSDVLNLNLFMYQRAR